MKSTPAPDPASNSAEGLRCKVFAGVGTNNIEGNRGALVLRFLVEGVELAEEFEGAGEALVGDNLTGEALAALDLVGLEGEVGSAATTTGTAGVGRGIVESTGESNFLVGEVGTTGDGVEADTDDRTSGINKPVLLLFPVIATGAGIVLVAVVSVSAGLSVGFGLAAV